MKLVRSDATGTLELEEWLEVRVYSPSSSTMCADNHFTARSEGTLGKSFNNGPGETAGYSHAP